MERRKDESFEEYKERRTSENIQLKRWLRGRVVWDSQRLGTYTKPKIEATGGTKQEKKAAKKRRTQAKISAQISRLFDGRPANLRIIANRKVRDREYSILKHGD